MGYDYFSYFNALNVLAKPNDLDFRRVNETIMVRINEANLNFIIIKP